MNSQNTILQSKLKRLKINHQIDGDKVIIGKSKTDFITLITLVVAPVTIAVILIGIMLLESIGFNGKLLGFSLFLFGTASFNINRIYNHKKANINTKILFNNTIKIENNNSDSITIDSKSYKEFAYEIQEVNEETFHCLVYVIDNNNSKHKILGFDSSSEQYANDDLKWFQNYFKNFMTV